MGMNNMLPFSFPYLFGPGFYKNNYYKPNTNLTQIQNTAVSHPNTNSINNKVEDMPLNKKNNSESNSDNYFFELFGLKLYFDDILIMALLFFLYEEGVKDNELFFSLILLLLS